MAYINTNEISYLNSILEKNNTETTSRSPEEVEKLQEDLKIRLPESYKEFLYTFGSLEIDGLTIYGIGPREDLLPSVKLARQIFDTTWKGIPVNILPIESLSPGYFACLNFEEDNEDPPIILWDFKSPPDAQLEITLSTSFSEYLAKRVRFLINQDEGFPLMEEHVSRFEDEYLKNEKLARNHIWRPFRFAVQDVLLGLVVVRHSLENNNLEVDVCLTGDSPEYEVFNGAKMTLAFLLSEAYRCGGNMEIKFTTNVQGGMVPHSIEILSAYYGIDLKHVYEGRISTGEAKLLFIALSEFPTDVVNKIAFLDIEKRLSSESVCFALSNGIWAKTEIESIVLGNEHPDRLFRSEVGAETRHLYQRDLAHGRGAIIGGYLDEKLLKRERAIGEDVVALEDDVNQIEVSFDGSYYAKKYTNLSSESVDIPWLIGNSLNLQPGQTITVLIRGRNLNEIERFIIEDLQVADIVLDSLGGSQTDTPVFIAYPRDMESYIAKSSTITADNKSMIMVCPEYASAIDMDVESRLSKSRILRQ